MGPGLYSDIGKKARGQDELLFSSILFSVFLIWDFLGFCGGWMDLGLCFVRGLLMVR
jgi:energy-converting hydrogenase Eha subunit F